MERAGLVALLLVLPALTGCLGSVEPATIPQSTLSEKNWELAKTDEQSIAMGLGQLVTKDYRPRSGGGPLGGGTKMSGAIVATSNDVPVLDETRFIPRAIEKVEKRRNIDLKEAGTTELDLPNVGGGTTVTAQLYTFTKSGIQGKAALVTPACGPFVVAVGYGVVAENIYREAKNVARHVKC